MMKIVGIAILMISSALVGLSFYKKYKIRPNSLNMFISLFNTYLLELKWKRKTFAEVVKQNKNNNNYLESFARLIPFNSLSDSAIKNNDEFDNLFLLDTDSEVLKYFFDNTGKGSLENEITLCQNTINLLQANKEQADISMKKMGPLSIKISIILGLWIAIILL